MLSEDEQIRQAYRCILERALDIGVAKLISSCLFEPSNIFDPKAKKRLRPEVTIAVSYIVLMSAIFAAFNLR